MVALAPYRKAPSAESLARVRRIAAALADELVEGVETEGMPAGAPGCPGCGEPGMVKVKHGEGLRLDQCRRCGGAWLAIDDLVRLEHHVPAPGSSPSKIDPQRLRAEVHAMVAPSSSDVEYRSCPTCDAPMHRRNFAEVSGVIVDECRGHGVYLDRGELEAIEHFVANGGLELRARVRRERADAEALRRDRRDKFEAERTRREAAERSVRRAWWLMFD